MKLLLLFTAVWYSMECKRYELSKTLIDSLSAYVLLKSNVPNLSCVGNTNINISGQFPVSTVFRFWVKTKKKLIFRQKLVFHTNFHLFFICLLSMPIILKNTVNFQFWLKRFLHYTHCVFKQTLNCKINIFVAKLRI